MGLIMYLLPLVGLFSVFAAGGAQGLALIAPLVLWLIKKDESPYLDKAGKEVINFNICAVVCFIVIALLIAITAAIWRPLAWPFRAVGFLVWIAWLVNTIISAVSANSGKLYRFPLSYRIIK